MFFITFRPHFSRKFGISTFLCSILRVHNRLSLCFFSFSAATNFPVFCWHFVYNNFYRFSGRPSFLFRGDLHLVGTSRSIDFKQFCVYHVQDCRAYSNLGVTFPVQIASNGCPPTEGAALILFPFSSIDLFKAAFRRIDYFC